jgi:nicotinamide mononucleotide (NMN) deamidase PncC
VSPDPTGEPVVRSLALDGDREEIRRASVEAALCLLRDSLLERE